jgi:hypothetical protein
MLLVMQVALLFSSGNQRLWRYLGNAGIHLARLNNLMATICAKRLSLTSDWLCLLLMYLGLVLFTHISCHETGTGLVPCLPFTSSFPTSSPRGQVPRYSNWTVALIHPLVQSALATICHCRHPVPT